MPRRTNEWRDIKQINVQINYEADPEVATFIYESDSVNLSRLIKNLIRQHIIATGHRASDQNYCRTRRHMAMVESTNAAARHVPHATQPESSPALKPVQAVPAAPAAAVNEVTLPERGQPKVASTPQPDPSAATPATIQQPQYDGPNRKIITQMLQDD